MSNIIVSRSRHTASISLDRPQALNSLTLEMVRDFARALDEFGADRDVVAVIVTGEGGRAFCAGGDIRALYEAAPQERSGYAKFWREEYQLNSRIAAFPKPYVAVMDGIVMGGGVGLASHGSFRIVTERTRLAMPETGIGFIPDVGGTWLLTRNGGVGLYMALAGDSVGAQDAISAGLADVFIDSSSLPELLGELREVATMDDVRPLLARYARHTGLGPLAQHEALLRRTMAHESVAEMIAALRADGSEFARKAADTIAMRSPTSLKLTALLLKRAANAQRLEDCLLAEYRAACNLLRSHDLFEGIRAAVIDKDRRPRWSPATLDEVDDSAVAALLESCDEPEPNFRAWT
ncbi:MULTISPECIES: enoyl-CoA hydratase/isomerase family protein [Methylosinus]|uniref:3-hydroxyisobutyryl-CoA hydrolase n=1 Tax=Methylosinus trichosporium (strain ATCC 35070 / NCIMB 11131 / UNIQEM 75 / OB3b) TaxID=595536 RepID=A0A2D2D118_METT3|nr:MULTISPECIES: enoyl-CoA hydratase/isomerase family protein [Methylosinus]ATQ68688.1 enoyl-CoA hydratase/isomerase family protein [Methylosinus trichosporium OB3b]OBS53150.1 3-hydroxyisobutyryl-CoA hydrolase [Methylosinus sp. 3S-1]